MRRVSVVIPTCNRAHLVGRAIQSVLAQTYQDLEVIVVDDASTDHTADVLAQYAGAVRCLQRETNGGPGAARNDGIRASTGELVAFLDSDDIWLPRRLEAAVGLLDECAGIGAAYTDCEMRGPDPEAVLRSVIEASGCRKPIADWRDVARHEPMCTPAMTIRRVCLEEVGLFNERLRQGEDSELWLRLSHRYPIGQCPEVLAVCHRREVPGRASSASARRMVAVWGAVLGWLPGDSVTDMRFARSRLARARWLLAVALRAEADPGGLEAHRQAASYCLANRLPLHLAAGTVMWHAPGLAARARRVRGCLRRLKWGLHRAGDG